MIEKDESFRDAPGLIAAHIREDRDAGLNLLARYFDGSRAESN
jgi:hypothetical protein